MNCPFSLSDINVLITLQSFLLLAAALFTLGLIAVLTRRNAIMILIGIELMLSAANVNFLAFWRFCPHPEALTGMIFVLFSIAVAAGEAAVGLALIIAIYKHYKSINPIKFNLLNG